jgi:hypothetical protein
MSMRIIETSFHGGHASFSAKFTSRRASKRLPELQKRHVAPYNSYSILRPPRQRRWPIHAAASSPRRENRQKVCHLFYGRGGAGERDSGVAELYIGNTPCACTPPASALGIAVGKGRGRGSRADTSRQLPINRTSRKRWRTRRHSMLQPIANTIRTQEGTGTPQYHSAYVLQTRGNGVSVLARNAPLWKAGGDRHPAYRVRRKPAPRVLPWRAGTWLRVPAASFRPGLA